MSEQSSRRDFLIASACAVASGCGADDGVVTEPIGDPSQYPNSSRQPTMPMDNGMNMPQCPATGGTATPYDASSLAVNQATPAMGRIVVCRDSSGLFALDLTCTHSGCQPALDSTSQPGSQTWLCPCHSSRFAFNGDLLEGPAARPLPRFYACRNASGKLVYDRSKPI